MYTCRTIEHTADIGLEVEAPSLSELFEGAALGMSSMAVEPVGTTDPLESEIALAADDLEELMFLWLNELLFNEESGLVLSGADLSVDGTDLRARVSWERLDPERHSPKSEIKAATYHGLKVERSGESGWKASVIFDV